MQVMTFEAIQVREDSYVIDAEDIVRVKDSFSTQIMYAEAVTREEALRHEMMLIGTHYLKKFKVPLKASYTSSLRPYTLVA